MNDGVGTADCDDSHSVQKSSAWDGTSATDLAQEWHVPVVEAWARIGSTNDRGRALGLAGAARGTVVVAEEQTTGRGRRGATWQSPAGSGLWMSIVLSEEDARPYLPLVIGVACAQAVETTCPEVRVGIKWPNDLLLGRRKVGGILCEAAAGILVAGIGINVSEPDRGFDPTIISSATSLEGEGANMFQRSVLAGAIVGRVMAILEERDPYGAVEAQLAERDALRDAPLSTERCGEGIARGIDPSGALRLERPDGSRVRVVSGSVRFAEAENDAT